MANPIFKENRSGNVKKVFTAKQAKLALGGEGASISGVLVQGINFTFQQNISRIYDLEGPDSQGKLNSYYVIGRAQGNAQLSRVIGPEATIKQMYAKFGNACEACKNQMTFSLSGNASDCCGQQDIKYILISVVLTQVGISLNANDMLVNENSQLTFNDMEYE